ASFNVEAINGNTDYIYMLKSNYSDMGNNGLNDFAHRMILNNEIRCLIPFTYEVNNEYRQLRYSMPKSMVLSDYLKHRFTDISTCTNIIINILKTLKTLEEYMIDRRFILFDADYMFLNINDNSISAICIPINDPADCSLSEFMRSIVMPMNLQNVENGDSFKVRVYQYPFDTEMPEDAIAYFSKLDFSGSDRIASEQPLHRINLEEPMRNIGRTGILPASEIKQPSVQPVNSPLNVPLQPDAPKKEKIPGIFGKLMGSSTDKKTKAKNEKKAADVPPSNPFGINIPGEKENDFPAIPKPAENKPQEAVKQSQLPLFGGGMRVPAGKHEAAAAHSAQTASPAEKSGSMMIHDDEKTLFEVGDDAATEFIDNTGSGAAARAYLKDMDGNSHEICCDAFTIGRSGKSGIKIDLDIPQKTVSHFHATIYIDGGSYFIVDNNSANGTFLDNKRLLPNEKVELTDNCHIRISNIDFTFLKA
ncbi:MAG: DUF6382 domain-containing protein, partial [Ruminiclostridium sp.]